MKKIAIGFVLVSILFAPLTDGCELAFCELELPTLLHEDWLLKGDSVGFAPFPILYDLRFYLSENGCVDSIQYESDDEFRLIGRIIASLNNIDFSPAGYKERKMPFICPARLEFSQKRLRKAVTLTLPYNRNEKRWNDSLMNKALEFNGFIPASIKKVPPYYCHFRKEISKTGYPFALYNVTIDSSAHVQDVEIITTNSDHYASMFSNVLLFAEYQAAAYNGINILSNLFITARFFPRLPYPTDYWPPSVMEDIDLSWDYHRIVFRPYLDSIVNPPMPANLVDGGIIYKENMVFYDSVRINVNIDTMGTISSFEFVSPTGPLIGKISRQILKKIKYFPANDINGRKIGFAGQIILIFKSNSKNIRIVSNWLL
jgi:hypothetical protein